MKKIIVLFIFLSMCFNIFGCNNSQNINLNEYDINVKLNDDMTANCNMYFNYYAVNNEVNFLQFNLFANAFSKDSQVKPIYLEYFTQAYPNGVSYGGIEIQKVMINGENINFTITQDNCFLIVPLPNIINKYCEVYIDFDLVLPNVKHRFGYFDNTINLTGFYPILSVYENGEYYPCKYTPSGDPFYSNCAKYNVDLTLPSKYVVASSLTATATKCMGDITKYSYAKTNVRDIAFIISEKFNVEKINVGEVGVYYYYFQDENPEKSLTTVKNSLQFFSEKFIEYPYREYVVCQSDFIYGGMEYPNLIIIDSTLEDFSKDYCLVHETAHQWWYGIVGNNECEEGYIDEGLTEFSTLLFFKNYNYGVSFESLLDKVKKGYVTIRKALVDIGNTSKPVMNKSLKDFTSDLEYISICYYRSQLMFNSLYEYMGERRFYNFLRKLANNYKYKNITGEDLINMAQKHKKGSKELLKSYVYGQAIIE